MLTLSFINVCSRFIFHIALSSADEVVTGLFVLISLMGSSVGVRKKIHLGLTVVTDAVPKNVQRYFSIFIYALSTVFCGYMTYLGFLMAHDEFAAKQITASMQWPEWIYGAALPIGYAFITVRFLIEFIWAVQDKEIEVPE